MSEDILGVVLDTGSLNTKAGFVGEPAPRVVLPTTVARKKYILQYYILCPIPTVQALLSLGLDGDIFRRPGLVDGIPLIYCGAEAIKNRGISELVWPVKEGMVQNWDELEKLWHHIYYKELHVAPENSRIMHISHPLTPDSDKERMAEILFETFAINGLYIAKTPSLVLHACGRTSGVVWENGYSCSYATPVFEGFPLKYATVTSLVTGKMLTERLQNLMLQDQIKKDICYVSQDYEKELAATAGYGESKVKYVLPDGQHILLGEERFQCCEILFKPELGDLKCSNIIDTICRSIDLCDIDYRSLFYNNIVFSGGTSMITGLVDRVTMELTNRLKKTLPDVPASVEAIPLRQYAAWAGGSMLASLSNLRGFWLTKEEYEDSGPERVKYKFF